MNPDPLTVVEEDEEPFDNLEDGPGWPAAWALLAIGIVALVVFAAAWSRS